MQSTNRFRFVTGCVLSLSLSHLPQVAFAETVTQNKMISTTDVLEQFNRKAAQEKVANFLSQQDVQKKLVEQGLSADEAAQRIASLSDVELQNLSSQIDKAQYGGDILFTILIVILIIYLVKRI